ncbi:hypothetical protein [Nocardiopsis sp. FR26]|uniref:hypothetical protein n=1 Tax=Nocardiopsis sp. FR26 TaxID=2605987 RepID=UPI00135BC503|nr:hypothetical protein [Nocardiopsis sp. FR26]
MSVTDVLTVLIALAALGVSIRSMIVSSRSADSAAASAEAAKESASEAGTMRRIESDRRHEELVPVLPAVLQATPEPHPRLKGQFSVFVEFTVERDYQVRAWAVYEQGESPLSLPDVVAAGSTQRLYIETRNADEGLHAREVRFAFWPAPDHSWGCACPGVTGPAEEPEGHWTIRRSLSYTPPPGAPMW